MFDLERQIADWRRALAGALGGRPEVIDELEDHLREEVGRQALAGLTPEAAWAAALARLGAPEALAAELAKVPPRPAAWLPARVVLVVQVGLAALLAWRLGVGTASARGQPLLACHVFAVVVGYGTTFAVGALAAWAVLARALLGWDGGRAEALRSAARRQAAAGLVLTAVGVVLGAWWAREHLGRWWGWDLREVGGAVALAWGALLLACLRGRARGTRPALGLGVTGNVVMALCWFGPALGERAHSYGGPSPALLAVGAGFLLAQALLLGLVLAPERWLVGRRA